MKNLMHPSWKILIAIFIIMFTLYAIPYNTTNLFIGTISEDLQITRAKTSLIMTLRPLGTVLVYFFSGWLFNRFKLKHLILFGTFGTSLFLIIASISKHIVTLYISYFFIGVSVAFISEMVFSILVNNWFVEKTSFANGLYMMGTGLGGAFFSFISGLLMLKFDWRLTIQIITAISFMFSILAAIYIKTYPSEIGALPYGTIKKNEYIRRGITYKELKRRPIFWINIVLIVFLCFGSHLVIVSLPDHLNNIGYSLEVSANVTACILVIMAFMKAILGILYDKYKYNRMIFILNIVLIVGTITLLNAKYIIMFPLIAICFGIGSANFVLTLQVAVNKKYGNIDYARIYRWFLIINTIIGSFGPVLAGITYDLYGSYIKLYKCILVSSVILLFILQVSLKKVDEVTENIEKNSFKFKKNNFER